MMQKQQILLTENHHAGIILAFYKVLLTHCGRELGLDIFHTAERAYGNRRGRRMAMRALRDKNPLNLKSYFTYGELTLTNAEMEAKAQYEALPGTVHERQHACGWAEEFQKFGCTECGVQYCREIDSAVIRGFNPTIGFSCPQNMHLNTTCDFYYHGSEVASDFMSTFKDGLNSPHPVKQSMAYHCADIWQMFCFVISQVLPDDCKALIEKAKAFLTDCYGEAFFDLLESYNGVNFETI